MIFLTMTERTIKNLDHQLQSLSWSIGSAGVKAKRIITDRSTRNNRLIYVLWLLALFIFIIILPTWGSESELFLCAAIFDNILGNWSKILRFIYLATVPYLIYSSFRIPFMFLYYVLQIQTQIFLLGEHILQISDIFPNTNNANVTNDVSYQNKINKRLCLFSQQHCDIKRY
jgi:hypothetical protein